MQAAVFLTHLHDPVIDRHFLRLRAEASGVLDVFRCTHVPPSTDGPHEVLPGDFQVTDAEARRMLPLRHAERMLKGGNLIPGFADLAYMPLLLSVSMQRYDHLWLVEYDVDYSGNWRTFFQTFSSYSADYLSTTIYPRQQDPEWMHWRWFRVAKEVSPEHHTRSFAPIVRFSRRMLAAYEEAMQQGTWGGHSEAIYPTLARFRGLLIRDLGGHGPFTSPPFIGRNYSNTPGDEALAPGTFVARPALCSSYYEQAPDLFPQRDFLYHPVKPTKYSFKSRVRHLA